MVSPLTREELIFMPGELGSFCNLTNDLARPKDIGVQDLFALWCYVTSVASTM